MRTIVAGSRGVEDPALVLAAIQSCGWTITEVVSGGARGVDSLGESLALQYGVPCKVFPANWSLHGKAAGPIRNEEMARYAQALVAVWDGQSRGTRDMINRAKSLGLFVYIHYFDPNTPHFRNQS